MSVRYWNGDEWRWHLEAPAHRPTMYVTELGDDVRREREEKVKSGARVVPFGFARACTSQPEPQVWKGEE